MAVRLFSREGNDRTLTAAGRDMLPLAEQIEKSVNELGRNLMGRDNRLSGTVRVTTTDTLAATLIPSLITAFRKEYPDIQIMLIIDDKVVRLSLNADVSLRPARAPEDDLIGKPVCKLSFAIYGPSGYAQTHGLPKDSADLWNREWVIPAEVLEKYPVTRWMGERVPKNRIAATSTSVLTMAASVRSGLGLALLPCFLGDADPQLERLSETVEDVASTLWLLTHRDLKECARVRAFLDFTSTFLSQQRDLIEGRRLSQAVVPLLTPDIWGAETELQD